VEQIGLQYKAYRATLSIVDGRERVARVPRLLRRSWSHLRWRTTAQRCAITSCPGIQSRVRSSMHVRDATDLPAGVAARRSAVPSRCRLDTEALRCS